MKRAIALLSAASLAALLVTGCDSSPSDGATAGNGAMPDMPATQQQAESGGAEHMAEGTVNSVDRAAGTVNLSHGPVASASWPAMTMSFKLADPDAAATLSPGQKVQFRFTIESGMSATVTQIEAAE
jgi:Cu/Ag efflux protein CusF